MNEKRFKDFTEFLKKINLSDRISDTGILILDLKEVSEMTLREFSMYRNEFYEMNMFKGLKDFRYAIDGTIYKPDEKPILFFVAPNQLQSYEFLNDDTTASGYLIYIRKSFFKQIERISGIHYFKREYESSYQVPEEDYQRLLYWADLMYNESKLVLRI